MASPVKMFADRRMRVAIVAPHFPEYSLRYAAALSEHADVCAIVDQAQCDAEYAGRALPIGRHDVTFTNFSGLGDLLRIRRVLKRMQPDVLHVQEAVGRKKALILLALFATASRATRLVVTIHDPRPHEGSDDRRARRFSRVKNAIRNRADVLVVHGERCRALLPKTASRRQIIFASEHGVLLDDLSTPKTPGRTLRFLMFGRMEAYKGLTHLLEACRRLDQSGIAYELLVAGAGPELERLAANFAALPRVRVVNAFIPPLQLMQLLSDSEAVFLPYTSATQSGVAAAAFGSGCYVVASAVGGLQDVVIDGENGLLVRAGDPEAIAAAVSRLTGAPELRQRLSEGAEQTARSRLNWSRIAQDLYENCLRPLFADGPARRH